MITLVAVLASGLSQFGLGQSFVFTSRTVDGWAQRRIIVYSLLVIGSASILLAFAWTRILHYVPSAFLLVCLVLLAASQAVSTFLSNTLQVTGDARDFNVARLTPILISLTLIAWLFFSHTLTIESATAGTLAATAVGCTVACGLLLAGPRSKSIFSKQPMAVGVTGGYVSYGIKYHASIVLGMVVQNADKILMSAIGALQDFGIYSVAYNTSRFVGTIQESISVAIYSKFAGRPGEALSTTTEVAFRLSFLPLLLIAAGIAAACPFLFPHVYGAAYRDAAIPCGILLLECVVGGGSWLLAQRFVADGRPGLVLFRQAVSLIPIFVVVFHPPADKLALYLALALLASSILRLALTIAMYKVVLHESPPRIFPTGSDLRGAKQALRRLIVGAKARFQ